MGDVVLNVTIGLSHCIGDLLNLGDGVMFYNGFVSNVGLILGLVLNLFIVGVWNLHGVVVCVLNGLVISYGFSHIHRVADRSYVLVDILSFVRNLFVGNHRLVIGVSFLDWHMFNPSLRLGSSVSLLNGLSNYRLA
jgi:hypothetical protein